MSDLDRARLEMYASSSFLEPAPEIRAALLEAADRIEALEKALQPFALAADAYEPPENDDNREAWAFRATIGQLRAARAALKGAP